MDYWKRSGHTGKPRTADHISVQNLAGLAPELIEANAFPFRLGKALEGTGTAFALARSERIEDFFLKDSDVFLSKVDSYEPDVDRELLQQFVFLSSQVEVNTVNLAIASGLLARALRLDADTPRIAPATISSTFSFPVRPTPRAVVHEHVHGQVEIDAAFLARRDGYTVLVVLEAKHGRGSEDKETLAKTKLAYPASAICRSPDPPAHIPIVPVYLRSFTEGEQIMFRVVECVWPGLDSLRVTDPEPPAVTSLEIARVGPTLRLELDPSWALSVSGTLRR